MQSHYATTPTSGSARVPVRWRANVRIARIAPWPAFVLAGAVIGTLMGLFGVGGSSIATPLLSLLGVPGLIAIASPLPATVPGAAAGAVAVRALR